MRSMRYGEKDHVNLLMPVISSYVSYEMSLSL